MRYLFFLFILPSTFLNSQNINLNNDFNYSLLRNSLLSNEISIKNSLNIRPINLSSGINELFKNQYTVLFKNKKKNIEIKSLGIDYFVEFNSRHPYNRNNGTMIPNRGYQFLPVFFLDLDLFQFNLSLNITIAKIKVLMDFGKVITQLFGPKDIIFGIISICLKDLVKKDIIKCI